MIKLTVEECTDITKEVVRLTPRLPGMPIVTYDMIDAAIQMQMIAGVAAFFQAMQSLGYEIERPSSSKSVQ